MKRKDLTRRCAVFMCDRKRLPLCCADCPDRGRCRSHCLNSPERCGLVEKLKTKGKS